MIIVGAGLAGLIAANYFRKQSPTVMEQGKSLPNNHAALLRFRSDKVFKVAGLPAKRVTVRKSVVYGNDFMSNCNPYLANQYSLKVTGKITDRSIWNLETEDRYIAPSDFSIKLANGCNILFGKKYMGPSTLPNDSGPVISTMPMPILMKYLKWQDIPNFEFKPIWVVTAEIAHCHINQTIYFPQPDIPEYRASIVGSHLIIELVTPVEDIWGKVTEVIDFFGLEKASVGNALMRKQLYGKMIAIDDQLRKEFMHYATAEFGVYSLGRFATWRPILLDDVVDDLAVIERMMSSKYSTRLLT
jgi:hypothetical protein